MNKKIIITMVILLFAVLVFPLQAFAMTATTVELPFTIENVPGTVTIEAVDNAPLPEITELTNTTEGKFEMSYTEPDNFQYKVYQKTGDRKSVKYDTTVYDVAVSIFVNDDGELYPVVVITVDGQKVDKIDFINVVSSNDTPQTGDNNHVAIWFSLAIASLIGMAVTLFFGLRKKVK